MRTDFSKWSAFRDQSTEVLDSIKLAIVNCNSAIYVTERDDVFQIQITEKFIEDGYANYFEDNECTKKPRKLHELCKQEIKTFVCYQNQNFAALTQDGRLFTWGANQRGQLGHGTYKENPNPKLVQGQLVGRKVVQFVYGLFHSAALTDQGLVFHWGYTFIPYKTWMRHFFSFYFPALPKRVTSGIGKRNVVAIACNIHTLIVLLQDGQLYSWGENYDGELGIGNLKSNPLYLKPVPVCGLDGLIIKQVACGSDHCLALTDSGQIFAWGSISARLGKSDTLNNNWKPGRVASGFGRAVQIAAAGRKSAAQFEDGTVRACNHSVTEKAINLKNSSWVERANMDEVFAPNNMWRVVEGGRSMAEELALELDDKRTADVCVHVGEKEIWAHKKVLIPSCPYFDFLSRSEESEICDFRVEEFSYNEFYSFLEYIYTDKLWSSIDLTPFKKMADYYGLGKLQEQCLKQDQARLQRKSLVQKRFLKEASIEEDQVEKQFNSCTIS